MGRYTVEAKELQNTGFVVIDNEKQVGQKVLCDFVNILDAEKVCNALNFYHLTGSQRSN